jgi:2-methylcitrate dehydratase PrpD
MSGSAAADTRPSDTRMDTPILTERRVAAVQAAFYISTGVWPLLHRHSFERLTGRKADFWLAQTVGATVAAIGAGLAHAASQRRHVSPELRTVAMTSAAGLTLIDLIFVARKRISRVYLVDATAEAALIAAWARAWTSRSNQNEQQRGGLPVG